jgi:hypothetical protein
MFRVGVKRKKHRKIPSVVNGPNRVKVGFPAGKVAQEILDRAVWNHFGTSGGGWGGPIPERPFLRNAITEHKSEYRRNLKNSAAKILRGDTSMRVVLSKLGVFAQGHIQNEITNLSSPPNSPVTVALKGSSNPLIDSGEMRGKVTWKVDDD